MLFNVSLTLLCSLLAHQFLRRMVAIIRRRQPLRWENLLPLIIFGFGVAVKALADLNRISSSDSSNKMIVAIIWNEVILYLWS